MTLVVDASFVVAALVDKGPDGTWADRLIGSERLVAPHLMLAEAANIIRLAARAGDISENDAALAHASLCTLRIEFHPYEPLSPRIWELRHNVTSYDAWYVALAESLDVPLATLDERLTRAPGPLCEFLTPG